MDDKKKEQETTAKQDSAAENVAEKETRIQDMKQELEDYIEEQGIYIRQ